MNWRYGQIIVYKWYKSYLVSQFYRVKLGLNLLLKNVLSLVCSSRPIKFQIFSH